MTDADATAAKTSKAAVWSLILGIVSFLILPAPIAFILAIVAMIKISGSEGRLKGMGLAIGGMVCSVVLGFFGLIVIPVLAAILLPAIAGARSAADQAMCTSHLRQIGMALAQYRMKYDVYPPVRGPAAIDLVLQDAGIVAQDGKPIACCPKTGRGSSAPLPYRGPVQPLAEDQDASGQVFACDEDGTHPNRIQVLMADGTVKTIESMDPHYSEYLSATRAR